MFRIRYEYDMRSPKDPSKVLMSPRGRELVENEEQDENKKMKSIVVEEQEQEEGSESESESETGFVDLDQDTLLNVLKRVDLVTLGRAECVNKLWSKVARDDRLWEPIATRFWASTGRLEVSKDYLRWMSFRQAFRASNPRYLGYNTASDFNSIPDFFSIDPQVFSSQKRPWVQNIAKRSVWIHVHDCDWDCVLCTVH